MTTANPPRAGALLRRVFTLELETRAEGDTARVVEASLSSEEPVERVWGVEFLSHAKDAVDLTRARDGLPLLWQHDPRELVSRVEAIRLRGRRLRGRLRFGNSQRARDVWEDVGAGVCVDVSIGYAIEAVEQGRDSEDRVTYTATRWAPLEVSLVSIPADATVGIGRSRESFMGAENQNERASLEVRDNPAATRERERVLEIQSIGERFGVRDQAQRAIAEGWPLADFRAWTLKQIPPGAALAMPPTAIGLGERSAIGIGGRELADYSLVRAASAFASKDWRGAGLELEASDAVATKLGRRARGFFVPFEVLSAPIGRAVEKAGSATGAALVGTELVSASFVELLRNRARVRALGATMLPGLIQDVDIPRQTGAATAAWLAEGGTSTPSDSAFDAVALSPKTVAASTNVTRRMLLQGAPAIEMLVRADLATVLALAVDLAAMFGTASGNQPRGIVNVSGVGSVAIGTNGGAPTWPHMIALESEVAIDNADGGSLGYITNSKVRGKLKATEKATNTAEFVWEQPPGTEAGFGVLNGYRAAVSNQVPSNLVKGTSGAVCSAIIFGDWSALLIGEWGTLDVMADPYALGSSGGVVLRGFYDVDIAVRHPEAFAVLTDATTT
jgi:HK97 family phage major capsid protein/HK97 family phage prohead protease